MKLHSPHPFHPGELCVTVPMDPPVYQLPPGLAAGAWVRTISFDHGTWLVESIEDPGQHYKVPVVLLHLLPPAPKRV